ncbi:hypothetical protein BDM02DRAFT_3131935 [Thelephora ganbajun]|uniref:Uncharacterized protein n=1 Tax=Thelephora ganbajun TaxID=370292 RepID=A0ACB6Z3Q2_THEGA|nr:hypothetical protein BDM02DRAFT_3131935 [Thelephora ganbajun]
MPGGVGGWVIDPPGEASGAYIGNLRRDLVQSPVFANIRKAINEQTVGAAAAGDLGAHFEAGVLHAWRPDDDVDGAFKVAKDNIPYWVHAVLVVLGWNEAMVILFDPLYFATLIIGLAST